MKRTLIVFALLSAFILPLQTAQADSFTDSSDILTQVANITGLNATNWFGYLPNFSDAFDIAMLYSSASGSDPFSGQGVQALGFEVLRSVLPQNFFGNIVSEVVSSSGGLTAYEYNGATVELPGGTIFVSAVIDSVSYVFAMAPSASAMFPVVPVPASALLLGAGLAGIVAMRRKLR